MRNPRDDGKTLLIVGDPALSRSLMELVLRKLRYAVCCASTAAEAKRAIAHGRFSLVLIALNLPDGSGIELGAWLREQARCLDGVPVLIFGDAWDETAVRSACREAGLQGYLAKPLSISRLLGVIRDLTQQASPAPGSQPRNVSSGGLDLADYPVDVDRLAEITDGDPQLVDEIGSLYLVTAARYLEELRGTAGSGREAREVAHALKGASRNIGAVRVAELAERVEKNGMEPETVEELHRRVEEVRSFFEEAGSRERSGR